MNDFGDERTPANDPETGPRPEAEASTRVAPLRGEFSVSRIGLAYARWNLPREALVSRMHCPKAAGSMKRKDSMKTIVNCLKSKADHNSSWCHKLKSF